MFWNIPGPAESTASRQKKRDQTPTKVEQTSPSLQERPFQVRQMAILGNLCVGKTTLFDELSSNGEHSVNIPGSTQTVKRAVLAKGPGSAPKHLKRCCAGCSGGKSWRGNSFGVAGLCHVAPGNTSETVPSSLACRSIRQKEREGAPTDSVVATHLYDTPGSATFAANSEDEAVSRDLLLSGQVDSVLFVADAKNPRRSLPFALEVAEFDLPMLISLNMVDESEVMGVHIDKKILKRELGVPIVQTVATERQGLHRLSEQLLSPNTSKRKTRFPEAIEQALVSLEKILQNSRVAPRALGVLLLSGDQNVQSWIEEHLGELALRRAKSILDSAVKSFSAPLKKVISGSFYDEARRIIDRAVISKKKSPSLLVRFGGLAQRPLPGTLIGLGVLVLAYYWVGVFGATFVVDNLSSRLFEGILIPWCESAVRYIPSSFVRDAIMDPDFGLLPSGLFLAIGIVLPVLFCFYSLQAVLEDSGYLPRLAVLFDRLFRKFGLNGQGLIPLILGFSCIAMSVITARMLPSKKERNILTLLVVGIPCAPLLAVMTVILDKIPATAAVVVFGFVGLRIAVTGIVAAKILPGKLPDLILEIPQMRVPTWRVLLSKTWRRTWQFMREAVPVFLAASFIVFLIDRFGGLAALSEMGKPVVQGLLGLPDQAVQVFVKTAIRRENGATELEHVRAHFDNVQLVVIMLVMTFVMPCINTTAVIVKERGIKACLTILATSVAIAILTGALVNASCRFFGITFT